MERHTIPPVFDKNSKVLILGSFPSVKSREVQFYYGNPQNRFWRVLAELFGCELPRTNSAKEALLLNNNIALWDVIAACDIEGSEDSTIRNVTANDLRNITETANINMIFTNGGTADKLYKKYCVSQTGITAIRLPSTSPANAGSSIEKLVKAWEIVRVTLQQLE